MTTLNKRYLLQDLLIIVSSIIFAYVLVKTEAISLVLATTQEFEIVGSFIAGLFFTSVFTTAPAIVALGELSLASTLLPVAFFGALGAVIGDLVIFSFIRDRFSDHLMEVMHLKKEGKKIKIRNHLRLFRWVSFFVGGIILASPLPDEIGIGLLGFSKMDLKWFIPTSFTFNFIGIMLIGIIAHAV